MIKSALEPSGLSSWSLSLILYLEVTILPYPPPPPNSQMGCQFMARFPLNILSSLFDHLPVVIYNLYTVERFSTMSVKCLTLGLLNPTCDQNLISPYNETAESFTKIMRITEMMVHLTSSDCRTNSPCQYKRNGVGQSIENIDTDVRV